MEAKNIPFGRERRRGHSIKAKRVFIEQWIFNLHFEHSRRTGNKFFHNIHCAKSYFNNLSCYVNLRMQWFSDLLSFFCRATFVLAWFLIKCRGSAKYCLDILICRAHKSYPFMNGFEMRNRVSFADSMNVNLLAHPRRSLISTFIAERQAIFQCLETILTMPLSPSHSIFMSQNSPPLCQSWTSHTFHSENHILSLDFFLAE